MSAAMPNANGPADGAGTKFDCATGWGGVYEVRRVAAHGGDRPVVVARWVIVDRRTQLAIDGLADLDEPTGSTRTVEVTAYVEDGPLGMHGSVRVVGADIRFEGDQFDWLARAPGGWTHARGHGRDGDGQPCAFRLDVSAEPAGSTRRPDRIQLRLYAVGVEDPLPVVRIVGSFRGSAVWMAQGP